MLPTKEKFQNMKQMKSFKDYLESKELLRLALEDAPKVKEIYEIEKYCSIPVISEGSEEPTYIKLKPKDLIEILWENTPGDRTPKTVSLLSEDDPKKFAWSNAKIRSWVEKTTRQI